MSCNGWSNVETWLVNHWYGKRIREMLEENSDFGSDDLRIIVEDNTNERQLDGFVADVIDHFLNAVDWEELYKNLSPAEV